MSSPVPHLCLFTDSLEPSGVGEHMLTLAVELQSHYHVSFVCPPGPGGDPFLARAAGLGLEAVPEAVNHPAARRPFARWLCGRGVTVFHGHAGIGWEGHDGVYAAREANVPAVVRTEHLPYLITDPGQREEHRRVLQAVDCLIAVSEEARRTFAEAGIDSGKLRAVRNGITLRPAVSGRDVREELGLPPGAPLALTVGRFSEQKGHCYLAEAIPSVLARRPEVHFLWAGSGPLEEAARAQIRTAGVEGNVHLLGRRSDVPELLAAADLFVLPSLFEGLPLIVLEAMAAGLPVIGTRVCGTAEVVRDGVTGRLVPPRDPAALAEALIEALTQRDRAAQWGLAGRRLFESAFTAARMARQTASIYEETLLRTAHRRSVREMPLPVALHN